MKSKNENWKTVLSQLDGNFLRVVRLWLNWKNSYVNRCRLVIIDYTITIFYVFTILPEDFSVTFL